MIITKVGGGVFLGLLALTLCGQTRSGVSSRSRMATGYSARWRRSRRTVRLVLYQRERFRHEPYLAVVGLTQTTMRSTKTFGKSYGNRAKATKHWTIAFTLPGQRSLKKA
ncbi:MAG: hypothetical protein A3G40_11775 [Deltaproteobacteria bacterium RIFCSPLOWO2_12_FULL_57_22]|nr:MAG: hypothetical protein A3G40_11775 [Deltaproteobacteria bacterium RIFCSPLOWO2_12_FULL_57_22]